MEFPRYEDLKIVSARKPQNTHLWIETTAGVLYLVDSVDNTKLYKSTDKGDTWVQVDIDPSNTSGDQKSRDHKIKALWNDGTYIHGVDCDNDGTADNFDVWKLLLADDTVTEVGTETGADADSVYVFDIFKIGSDVYVWNVESRGGVNSTRVVVWDVDVSPFTEIVVKNYFLESFNWNFSYCVVVGTLAYIAYNITGGDDYSYLKFDSVGDTLVRQNSLPLSDYTVPTNENQLGIAYDGSDILISTAVYSSVVYLVDFSISGDSFTAGSYVYNVAMALDRNTPSGSLEKGFSINATETVYQIKPRKGGIIQLQDISALSDALLIGITHSFVINNDGDMFEYSNIEKKVSKISYNDGILPIPKKGSMEIHPDYEGYFQEGDSIEVYDPSSTLEFFGKITNKSRLSTGIYRLKIEDYRNELLRRSHVESFSSKKTSENQIKIIDDSCSFCYQSSSITATTTTYDYVYKRALMHMFQLGRFLERQVAYVEPDCKVWTKPYNSLVATGQSWDIADNDENVMLADIPSFPETYPGLFEENLGITRATVRYMNNVVISKPDNPEEKEQLLGINLLKEYRDPKIEAATEAGQLAQNLYDIFSSTIIILGLLIEGKDYYQPGKTIQIQNTGQIAITQDDFLIISFTRDPKNNNYTKMILSDNIILPKEFEGYFDTSFSQIHTAVIQSFENQETISNLGDPIGTIKMFSGTWVDNSTIPGWYKCDGNNGTVNLVNQFVRGGATSGATGGSDDAVLVSHDHGGATENEGVHTHAIKQHTTNELAAGSAHAKVASLGSSFANTQAGVAHGHTINSAGVSGTGKNIPAYYTLIFIQRIS